jgi:Predicted integral membrane protein
MDIFRYDSDFMQALGRIADLAWLNILCAICCFPIFTAGAAVTAKYYTAMKLERGQAPGVTKTFFRAFKENFLQDLKVTVILILICAFFAYDWLYIYKQGVGSLSPVVIGMLSMFTAMILIITFCVFPMIARFEMKTFDSLRNALVFGIIHLPRVALGIFLAVIPFVISIWYFKWAWLIWLFFACIALYYNSRFFIKSFDKLEERTFGPKETAGDPEYVLDDEKSDEEDSDAESQEEESEIDESEDEVEEPENDEEEDSTEEETDEETEEE